MYKTPNIKGVNENINDVKALLRTDKYVYSSFVSISGRGLCLLFKIKGTKQVSTTIVNYNFFFNIFFVWQPRAFIVHMVIQYYTFLHINTHYIVNIVGCTNYIYYCIAFCDTMQYGLNVIWRPRLSSLHKNKQIGNYPNLSNIFCLNRKTARWQFFLSNYCHLAVAAVKF